MSKALVKPERYTYADYYAWPDFVRAELIDGYVYDMSPAPTPQHQMIAGGLHAQLVFFFFGKPCIPLMAPIDVRFPRPGEEDGMVQDVVQPDVVVVCDRAKIDDRGCRGAPDWIIEVLSSRTEKNDLTLKRELYERNQVPLYWIISPPEKTLTVLKLDASGRYADSPAQQPAGRLLVFEYPGLEINWDMVFP
jgi:Uma2 family endonuclease